MAELTQEDKENYGKLQEAVGKIEPKSEVPALKKAKDDIKINEIPKDTEELRNKIERLERYREISNDLGSPIRFQENPEEAEKYQQQFLDSLEELKRSLEVSEDEKVELTEGIEKFQPDSLFLELITAKDPKEWTKELIDDLDPLLKEDEIEQLTNAWETAVTVFVDDARKKNEGKDGKVTPLQPETFAHFFRIHKELEVLYSRLADSETVRES